MTADDSTDTNAPTDDSTDDEPTDDSTDASASNDSPADATPSPNAPGGANAPSGAGRTGGRRRPIVGEIAVTLRDRPSLFAPFVLAGLLLGLVSVTTRALRIPVWFVPFPDRGLLHLPLSFVPGSGAWLEFTPGALSGLKLPFVLGLLGLALASVIVIALAFSIVLWASAPASRGLIPPARRVGWLVAYVLVVQGALFAAGLAASTVARTPASLVSLLVALFVAIGLIARTFLAPAFVVLEGARPVSAIAASVSALGGQTVAISGLVVTLLYAEYLLTGVAGVASGGWLGPIVATTLSTGVVGTFWALAVGVGYRRGVVTEGDDSRIGSR